MLATMADTSSENIGAVSRNAYLLVMVMDFFIGVIAYVTLTLTLSLALTLTLVLALTLTPTLTPTLTQP